jgi:hypothetical protein
VAPQLTSAPIEQHEGGFHARKQEQLQR